MTSQAIPFSSVKLYINGKPFGIATSFSWSTNAGRKSLYGIDTALPFELAPGSQGTTGRMSVIKTRLDGGLEGRGLAAVDHAIVLEKYISILLVDRITDEQIFWCKDAAVNSQAWQVNLKGFIEGSFEFTCLNWENEATRDLGI
jgi:hypothetical protein